MLRIGFVVLSHNNPKQVVRLCTRLATMFSDCAIACHHDFERSPVNVSEFPKNVRFVIPSFRTFWGHISLVRAELAALRLLYETYDPDWFYLLSGTDYPVQPAEVILADLQESSVDGFLDYRLIRPRCVPNGCTTADPVFTDWHDVARHRYLETMLSPNFVSAIENNPDLSAANSLVDRSYHSILIPVERVLPRNLPCYAGDHWLTGNRRIAQVLLAQDPLMSELLDFFHYAAIADEAIYHTRLCNMPGLNLLNRTLRYADWRSTDGHPKILGAEDLNAVWATGSHFARKFDPDTQVLDVLDTSLGLN